MPKIWAYRPGGFRPGGGWDAVISLPVADNLTYLIEQLEAQGVRNDVQKLGLVFHGNAGGLVQSDPVMTQASIFENPAVAGRVAQLRDYLTAEATVIFFCCMSGLGPEGTSFLQAISTTWPGRTVVGFVTSGYTDPAYLTAGDVFDVGAPIASNSIPTGLIDRDARGRITLPRMDPGRPTAKWARGGGIVRIPLSERVMRGAAGTGRNP